MNKQKIAFAIAALVACSIFAMQRHYNNKIAKAATNSNISTTDNSYKSNL